MDNLIDNLQNLGIDDNNTRTRHPPLKPLFKWSGGKADELPKIIPHIPSEETYDQYVEPFIGGGSLFFHLNPQQKSPLINDIHKELILFYKKIKEPNGLQTISQFMTEHPNNEDTYYRVRDLPESAERFYYLRKTCFRGMLRYSKKNNQLKFNIPFGRYKTCNYSQLNNNDYHLLLSKTTIENKDYKDVMDEYDNNRSFIFLDQPYDSKFTDYGYCSFDKLKQEELAETFKRSSAKCLMVVGDTPLIRNLYEDYIVESYDKKYKFKIHSNRVGNEINNKHLIIKNY